MTIIKHDKINIEKRIIGNPKININKGDIITCKFSNITSTGSVYKIEHEIIEDEINTIIHIY